MSYLGFPRLHFSGRFQADPSTVNNDPSHFDDATFTPRDQLPGLDGGWWNPDGTGYWRLGDCVVRSVCYRDGGYCDDPQVDPVVGLGINGASTQVSAKLVDLDPEQQMVSEIWGLQIHLGEDGGANSFGGAYDVAPFNSIWVRYPAGVPDSFFSAIYQSIITDIQWAEVITSRFLQELMVDGAYPPQLSIKFTVDGYDDDSSSPTFTWGRIVGVIGPYEAGEPHHFVAARLLRNQPDSPLSFAPCRLDEQGRLLMDLSNSLPTTAVGGPFQDLGGLQGAILPKNGEPTLLGPIHYLADGWYSDQAGIQVFDLTPEQAELAQQTPVGVVKMGENDQVAAVYLRENNKGTFARADEIVFRIDSGGSAQTTLYATTFGRPQADQQFDLQFDNSNAAGQVQVGFSSGPPVGEPASALTFPQQVTTDEAGQAVIELQASDPGNPRGYIDGQVYGVRYDWHGIGRRAFNNPDPANDATYLLNVLVWDAYKWEGAPTWLDNVQPILQQYANLYPIMQGIVDLSDYLSVMSRLSAMQQVFNIPVSNPNYMPVTRDLSTSKHKMIQQWLTNPLYSKITNVDQLKAALQQAIELEHATIPPYLCAFYSIRPGYNQEVAEIIRSVVIEEMMHMSMACNLLNAIGGQPQINVPGFVPEYPSKLPGGLRPDLTVHLRKCSIDQIREVFMSIEEPEETTHPEGHHPLTIGWFYKEIEAAFTTLSAEEDIFVGDPARQVEWVPTVTDLASAQAAINEIMEQGEGASPLDPDDEEGELSHFYKFEEIVRGRQIVVHDNGYSFTGAPILFDPDGVWPMEDDPNTQDLPPGSQVRARSEAFNQVYGNVLKTLHRVFNGHPDDISAAIGLMFSVGLSAQQLMQMPVCPGAAETAGPSFQFPG